MKTMISMIALLALLIPRLFAEELPTTVQGEPVSLEHHVYIPYDEFWQVFEKEDRGVFLPYDEFRKLWDAARETVEKEAPETPEGVAISEITGSARVTGEVVRVRMELTLDAMNPAWHEVPLGLKEVTISRATLDGQPARVRGDSDSGYTLLLHHPDETPGRHVLVLEFAAALQTGSRDTEGSGVRGFRFSLPPAPVSRWRLHIPEPGIELHSEPRLATATLPEEDPEKETLVEIFLAAAPALDVRWTPRVEGARDLDPMIQANLIHLVRIGGDLTRNQITAQLQISRAPVPQISFAIPADERVVDVRADNLRSWTVTETEEGQRLDVLFLEPVRGEQRVALDLERYQPPPRRAVPMVEVLDTVLQRGALVVSLDEGLRADATVVQGLTRQDPATVIREHRDQVSLDFGYQYRALPFALALDVEEVQPRITARNEVTAHLSPLALDLRVAANLEVRRAGVFHLEMDVPDGFTLSNVEATSPQHQLDGHQMGDPVDGRRILRFDFTSRVTGEVKLQFQLRHESRAEALLAPTGEEVFFDIPVVRAVGEHVESDEGTLLVSAPDYLTLRVAESAALRPVSNQRSAQRSRGGRAPIQFAFAYAADEPSLRVGALRRAPHTTVALLQAVRVEAGVARFEASLFSHVRYSGVRGLRLDVPADLAERIQIQNSDVRRRVLPDATDLEEGMTAWMLERPAEFLGETEIILTWETLMEGLDVGAQRALDIPRLIPREVDRAWGQVVLRKAEALDIAVAEISPELTPIDPRHDLMQGRSFPDAALAFEFHRDWSLTALVTRYEPAPLMATSIERGLVRQVLTRGGQNAIQALYLLRSTRQRLEVRLPENVEFDARPLRINGQPATLERGAAGHVYIPLTGQNVGEPLLLELRYTLESGGNRLQLPHFVEEPAVQQVYLSVHIPDNVVYLGHRGPWNPEYVWRTQRGFRLEPSSRLNNRNLLRWVAQGSPVDPATLDQLPVDGQHLLFSSLRPDTSGRVLTVSTFPLRLFHGVVIGGGILIGLLLLRSRLSTRLIVVAAILALLVLAAVFTPSLIRALLNDATVAGAFLVLVLWFVWDVVVRWPRYRRLRRAAREKRPTMPAETEEVHHAQ